MIDMDMVIEIDVADTWNVDEHDDDWEKDHQRIPSPHRQGPWDVVDITC